MPFVAQAKPRREVGAGTRVPNASSYGWQAIGDA